MSHSNRIPLFGIFWLFLLLQPGPALTASHLLHVKNGDVIVFEGDSLTYGQDESPTGGAQPLNGAPQGRSATPFPEYLGTLLGNGVTIQNHGFPGDRTVDGLQRWKDIEGGDVYFILYGTNDAGNFANLPGGTISVTQYATNLATIVKRRIEQGAGVAILIPPPVMDPAFNKVLQPYREAARDLARRLDLPALDLPLVLQPVKDPWVDGIHLSGESNRMIASAIETKIIRYGP